MAENNKTLPILQSIDFKEITRFGQRKKHGQFLVLFILDSNDNDDYFGLTISAKVGNAVLRNKLKRWVRMCVQTTEWRARYKNKRVVFLFKPVSVIFFKSLTYKDFCYELFK